LTATGGKRRIMGVGAAKKYLEVYHPDLNLSDEQVDGILKEWEQTDDIPFGQFIKNWKLR